MLTRLGYKVPRRPLAVEQTFFNTAPCSTAGEDQITVRLGPRESTVVYLTVMTKATRVAGVAAFNVVDERNGTPAGGVMVICADPPLADLPGSLVHSANPCPIAVATHPYPVPVGEDPSKQANTPLRPGDEVELVIPLTNPTGGVISEVTAYLEHLGSSDCTLAPGMWNVGTLEPGDVFFATWRITVGESVGDFQGSVVVSSAGTEHTRNAALITVVPSQE